MTASEHVAATSKTTHDASARDGFYDALKSLALVRVLAWHTWSWAWTSWIAAMPAMFFASGALLGRSLSRSSARIVVTGRLRRLLLPFLVYSLAAVTTMVVAGGWRPGVAQLLPWLVPLWDPRGPAELAPLWVPLWYLQAHLWFVLSGPLLWRVARLGWSAPVLAAAVGAAAFWLTDPPQALAGYVAFAPFVLAGMVVARTRLPDVRQAMALGAAAAVLLLVGGLGGQLPTIANETYVAVLLSGVLTCAVAVGARGPLRSLAGSRAGGLVDWVSARALTIYLWHGFGLLVADRLVWTSGLPGPIKAVLAGVAVFGVAFTLAALLGSVEDLAARRAVHRPRWRLLPVVGFAVTVLLVAAAADPPAQGEGPQLLSGVMILERTEEIRDELEAGAQPVAAVGEDAEPTGASVVAPQLVVAVDGWAAEHTADLVDLGVEAIEAAVAVGDDTVLLRWTPETGTRSVTELDEQPWHSMTKAVTAGWLLRLVEQGVVELDDPVSAHLDGVPHGDDITLAHLADHRSGIPTDADSPFGEVTSSGAELRAWLDRGDLAHPPGEGYGYSRAGYTLLAWALEEASGQSWRSAVEEMAAQAGTTVTFDEDEEAAAAPSTHPDPDASPYRGPLWSSAGLGGTPDAGARLFRWLYAEGLSPATVAAVRSFDDVDGQPFYRLGTAPQCPPCQRTEGRLISERLGGAAERGWWSADTTSGVALMVLPTPHVTPDAQTPPMWRGLDDALLAAATGA